jgi:hypothetical protein
MDNIQKLKKIAEVLNIENVVTTEDIEQVLAGFISILASFKKNTQDLNEETRQLVNDTFEQINTRYQETLAQVDQRNKAADSAVTKRIDAALTQFQKISATVLASKPEDGKPGKDANPEDVVPLVLPLVLEKIKIPEKDTAEEIREKLESLKKDERLDASAIKGLEQFTTEATLRNAIATLQNQTRFLISKQNGGGSWGSITGLISDQADLQAVLDTKLTIPSLTSGSVLFWNGTTIAQDNANFFWNNTTKKLTLSALTFGSSLGNAKLAVWDDGNGGTIGFGIQGSDFRFHVNVPTTSFNFYDSPNGNNLLKIVSFIGGTWLDLPDTGPSAIGVGGVGGNSMIAYCAGPGQYFGNALGGDIAYRNITGRLLWGNTSGDASMMLSGDKLGIGIDPTYKLDVNGRSRIQKDLVIGSGTPSTWDTYAGVFDGGTNAIVYGASGDMHLISNAVGLGNWTYYANGPAVNQYMYNGDWVLRTAGSGLGGANISWNTRLTVQNNGDIVFPGQLRGTGASALRTGGSGVGPGRWRFYDESGYLMSFYDVGTDYDDWGLYWDTNANALSFRAAGVNTMTINLGASVDFNVPIGAQSYAVINNDGAGDINMLRLSTSYDVGGRKMMTWDDSVAITGAISTSFDNSVNTTNLHFGHLYHNGYTSTDRMILYGTGNLSIGTTAKLGNLTVSGGQTFSGTPALGLASLGSINYSGVWVGNGFAFTNATSGSQVFSMVMNADTAFFGFLAGNTVVSAPMFLSASAVTLNVPTTVPDDAYAVGWNGSTQVPTKNAIYDKIETLAPLASPTFTGTLTTPAIKITGGSPGVGKVLTSDADGDATWETPAGGGSAAESLVGYYDNGGVATSSIIVSTGLDLEAHKNYRIVVQMRNASSSGQMRIRLNNDTASNYAFSYIANYYSSSASAGNTLNNSWSLVTTDGRHFTGELQLSKTASEHTLMYGKGSNYNTTSGQVYGQETYGRYQSTTNVTRMDFYHDNGGTCQWRIWIFKANTA